MNYQKELDILINDLEKKGRVPTLLLHSCCAPCSSYVISYLANYFKITILYYNPNISPKTEYDKRKEEQKRFIKEFKTKYPVSFLDCDYDNESYESCIKGLEKEPERGKRCTKCFELRLGKTAEVCKDECFDYFATTLTLSPYKNAPLINEIGLKLGKTYKVNYLPSDFKKKNGYLESIKLSKEYNLYRQDYCGCKYSVRNKINE